MEARYPNELPNLKLFASAKWRSVIPHVSTRADIERIMGEPSRIFDPRFYVPKFDDYLVGYDYDKDWIVEFIFIASCVSEP